MKYSQDLQVLGRTFPKMELAWIDTSNPALLSTASSRGPTCWNKLGTLPGDLEFNYVPSGSSNPEDYVPDSRIRLNFSDVAPRRYTFITRLEVYSRQN